MPPEAHAPRAVALSIRALVFALLAPLPCVLARAGEPDLKIAPGPSAITAAEKALAPDPGAGSESAVILVDEMDVNESSIVPVLTVHRRAKIHVPRRGGLADVVIPVGEGKVKGWWGRTLLPDGRVVELARESLSESTILKSRGLKLRVLKAALPGIVPGCVIDYGYEVWGVASPGLRRWSLQQEWPVKELRYRWTPSPSRPSGYTAGHMTGMPIQVTKAQRSVRIDGHDVPAARKEPLMPPVSESFASITFYYSTLGWGPEAYWKQTAHDYDALSDDFAAGDRALRDAIESMNLPAAADLPARLRLAYEWLAVRMKDTGRMTSEETEAAKEQKDKLRRKAREVLESGAASTYELTFLYMGLARQLGAQANLVLAVDRTDHLWDRNLLDIEQFDYPLVSVREPGAPDEKAFMAAPGTGLAFGKVPWWYAGAGGFLAGRKEGRQILVDSSRAEDNVSETSAEIRIGAGGDPGVARWTTLGRGQAGYGERLELRRLPPEERREKLEEMCGRGDLETLEAESPALEEIGAEFKLECEVELAATSATAGSADRIQAAFAGPWMEALPDFGADARTQPVVFAFPRTERTKIDVLAPPGFEPDRAPGGATVGAPQGKYTLKVTTIPGGFRIERELTILPLVVPVESYPHLRAFIQAVRRSDATPLTFKPRSAGS